MALIKCPECGEEISDKAKLCIHCGFPINEYLTENNDKDEDDITHINCKEEILNDSNSLTDKQSGSEKNLEQAFSKWIIVIGGFFVVCSIVFALYIIGNPNNKEVEMETSNEDVMTDEKEDGNFTDVKKMSEDEIKEEKLLEAINLKENGKYSEAIIILQSLGIYKNNIGLLRQCMYEYAKEEYEKGNYLNVAITLDNDQTLIDVSLKELKEEIISENADLFYNLGVLEYNNENFSDAIHYFYLGFKDLDDKLEDENYLLCEFMRQVQGEYFSEDMLRTASVDGYSYNENGTIYEITPIVKTSEYISDYVVGILNNDDRHYLAVGITKEGFISCHHNGKEEIWGTEEFFQLKKLEKKSAKIIKKNLKKI